MSVGASSSLARSLARDALWHEGECTWIGFRPAQGEQQERFEALGPDLFVGTAGISWFLAEAYAATREPLLRETAIGAIRHAARGSALLPHGTRCALHVGAAGVALAAARVALLTGDARTAADSLRLIDAAFASFSARAQHDLVRGIAGTIVAALCVSRMLAAPRFAARATGLGDRLIGAAERSGSGISWRSRPGGSFRNLTGMAHGASGIAVALLELFARTGEARYRAAALDAFAYERSLFDDRRQNWADPGGVPRRPSRVRPCFVAWWCRGAPGIALARVRACELLGDAPSRAEARAGLRTTLASLEADLDRGAREPALCHGLAGNAGVLLEGLPFLSTGERTRARGVVRRAARASFALVKRSPVELPDLFTGAAGVGWLTLRMAKPATPSVLLLRPEELASSPAGWS